MNNCCNENRYDYGPGPYVAQIGREACLNTFFRKAIWTGDYLQMTLMSIPPCGEIGPEVHEDTDQLLRIECGEAILSLGCGPCEGRQERQLSAGDAVFVPAGTWHNVRNAGRCDLKVSSVYAPPHHPRGTLEAV